MVIIYLYIIEVDVILNKMCIISCMICLSYFFVIDNFSNMVIINGKFIEKKIPLWKHGAGDAPKQNQNKITKRNKVGFDVGGTLTCGQQTQQLKVLLHFFKSGLSFPFSNSSRNSSPFFFFFFKYHQ